MTVHLKTQHHFAYVAVQAQAQPQARARAPPAKSKSSGAGDAHAAALTVPDSRSRLTGEHIKQRVLLMSIADEYWTL